MPFRTYYILIFLLLGCDNATLTKIPHFGNNRQIDTTIQFKGYADLAEKSKVSFPFSNISPIDTMCIEELGKALSDYRKGKLVYCHYTGNIIYNQLRCEKQMTDLLRKYGIGYKNEGSACIVYEDQTEDCYCDFMDIKIKKKYGAGFLDSLLNVADSLYAFSNPLDTFSYTDCDTRPHYPGERDNNESSYKLQALFDNSVNYPTDYIKRENRDVTAIANIYFVINQNGIASNVGYQFHFDHPENEKHEDYLMEIIDPLITETRWEAATIRNRKVISTMVIRIWFE